MPNDSRPPKFGHDGCREVFLWQRGWLVAYPLPITPAGELFTDAWLDLERQSRVTPFYRPHAPLVTFHRM